MPEKSNAADSRAETRRRNEKLARRIQLGLVTAGIAGSLGFTAAAATGQAAAESAEVATDSGDVQTGDTGTTQLGWSSDTGASDASTQGS